MVLVHERCLIFVLTDIFLNDALACHTFVPQIYKCKYFVIIFSNT